MKKYGYLCNRLELVLLGLRDIDLSLGSIGLEARINAIDGCGTMNEINRAKLDFSRKCLLLSGLELSYLLGFFEYKKG